MNEVMVQEKPAVFEDIIITPRAAHEVVKIKADNKIPEAYGLRLGVKGGGCSGMSYVLAFDERPRETDRVLQIEGLQVYVDPKSLFYLSGITLDFNDTLNARGFVFNNPNAVKSCGCGHSFGV